MAQYVRDAGVWKPVGRAYARDAGVWKPISRGYVRDAGVWKPFGYVSFSDLRTVGVHAGAGATNTVTASIPTLASPERYIIVGFYGAGSTGGVTVNGVAVTLTTVSNVKWGVVSVPTGTSVTVIASNSTPINSTALAVWSVVSDHVPVLGTFQATSQSPVTSPLSQLVTRPASGAVVGFAWTAGGSSGQSVSGVTDLILFETATPYSAAFHSGVDPDNTSDSQTWTYTRASSSGNFLYSMQVS